MDLEKRLKKIVLKTGEVNSVLGGFKIRVINPLSKSLSSFHQNF